MSLILAGIVLLMVETALVITIALMFLAVDLALRVLHLAPNARRLLTLALMGRLSLGRIRAVVGHALVLGRKCNWDWRLL